MSQFSGGQAERQTKSPHGLKWMLEGKPRETGLELGLLSYETCATTEVTRMRNGEKQCHHKQKQKQQQDLKLG